MEEIETLRRRLKYRASHRGTKELDIILGGFAEANLSLYSVEQLHAFEQLLQEEEVLLQSWLMRLSVPPAEVNVPLIEEIATDHARRIAENRSAEST